MLIEYSKILKLPVFEMANQTKIADFEDFFVDEKELTVDAAIVKIGGFFHKQKFILKKEIVDLSKNAIVVENEDSLADPEEVVRLEKKFKDRAKIIREKVFTKKGVFLGVVDDYIVESSSLSIVRIYLKKLFDQRIIHTSAIIKVEKNKIIVKDNFEMAKPELSAMPAETKLA